MILAIKGSDKKKKVRVPPALEGGKALGRKPEWDSGQSIGQSRGTTGEREVGACAAGCRETLRTRRIAVMQLTAQEEKRTQMMPSSIGHWEVWLYSESSR